MRKAKCYICLISSGFLVAVTDWGMPENQLQAVGSQMNFTSVLHWFKRGSK
jgi:hypothetical protein